MALMCSLQSLASYLLCLAVGSARGAIDVQRAVVGYLLTLPRSRLDSWRHQCELSVRWLLTYFASQSARLVAPVSLARGAIDVQ